MPPPDKFNLFGLIRDGSRPTGRGILGDPSAPSEPPRRALWGDNPNPLAGLSELLRTTAAATEYRQKIVERTQSRLSTLPSRIAAVTDGRSMPEADQLAIGTGRRFRLGVLFLDICKFSSWPNSTAEEQDTVLGIMNVFMAEMMNYVHDFGGRFEKNTGDGLMAYFPGDDDQGRVRRAVAVALNMHWFNDELLGPYLLRYGVPPIHFRVGIDVGQVTLGNVGVARGPKSIVAIGAPANVANKLMNNLEFGGICLGHDAYQSLSSEWKGECKGIGIAPTDKGFTFAYALHFRTKAPVAP